MIALSRLYRMAASGFLLLALLASARVAVAQEASEIAWIDVAAERADALVLIDSVIAGRVASGPLATTPGRHRVMLRESKAWNARAVAQDVTLSPGDTLRLALVLPTRTRIETLPLRAEVRWEQPGRAPQSLGTTPVVIDVDGAPSGTFVISKKGYETSHLPADAVAGERAFVSLTPEGLEEARAPGVLPEHARSSARWVDLGIGVATLAAGALAAYFKLEADHLDDRYRNPTSADFGKEAVRSKAEQYDSYSGVGLIGMQAGLGVLAVRFILR